MSRWCWKRRTNPATWIPPGPTPIKPVTTWPQPGNRRRRTEPSWRGGCGPNGPPTELTEGRQPNFSSNGRWIVYNHQDNIYKIEIQGGSPIQLTDTGHDSYPNWGWANDKIVFQRYGSGGYDIYMMNSDGTDVQELVATTNMEYTPSWSSDCSKIVYCGHRWSNFDIYVYVVP
jgi:Tol biopolymer transport system component